MILCKLTIDGFHRFELMLSSVIKAGFIELLVSPKLLVPSESENVNIKPITVRFYLKKFAYKDGFAEFEAQK